MKLIILTTLLASVFCTEAKSNQLLQADRREGVSYTTNVLHGDPNYPDQQAQSSVDFKFGSSESDSQPPQQKQQIKTNINPYTTPKSLQDYQQANPFPTSGYSGKYQTQSYKAPTNHHQVRQTKPQANYYAPSYKPQHFSSYGSQPQQTQQTQQSLPPHQSQSFNVGYSVKFTNGGGDRNKPYKAPRFESDIITGSHKEKVKKPPMPFSSSEEIPQNIYQDTVKVIKKYTKAPTPTSYPKHIISQSHVTPKTQKHLAYLETSNKYQPQEDKLQQTSASSPWLNLSPSVEIYRSKEVDIPDNKYEPSSFDHEKALGKSEGFDYTNAVDFSGLQTANKQFESYEKPPQAAPQPQALFAQTDSFIKSQYTEAKPTNVPKLPIDTSLLREPILTIHKQQMDSDSKQIPIHFDTSLIQEMGKQYAELFNQGGFNEPINVYDSNSAASNKPNNYEKSENNEKLNYQQFNNLLAEQSRQSPTYKYKDTDPMSAYIAQQTNQHEMKFSFPQNGLFNPKVVPKMLEHKQKPKMYMVQENVQEPQPQTPNQFKVFSKPANTFMRHEYEKMQKISNAGPPRQPRINPKRLIRDYSIETDLKPPPMPYKRLRRTQTKYIAM